MRPHHLILGIFLFVTLGCGGDPDPGTPPAPEADSECLTELSYRLYVTRADGSEMLTVNAYDFDPTTKYELTRLRSYVWGLEVEGADGLGRVEIGLPGVSCGTQWTITREVPSRNPSSLVFNTGEPLLRGYRWEIITATGYEPFPELTVQGDIQTAVLTENLEVLVRITGPETSGSDPCVIEHIVNFEVVK